MFLVTDGTLNMTTPAIVVDRIDLLQDAINTMKNIICNNGGDTNMVIVNEVGESIDPDILLKRGITTKEPPVLSNPFKLGINSTRW